MACSLMKLTASIEYEGDGGNTTRDYLNAVVTDVHNTLKFIQISKASVVETHASLAKDRLNLSLLNKQMKDLRVKNDVGLAITLTVSDMVLALYELVGICMRELAMIEF